MPKGADEETWQYMDRMVDLAHRILEVARDERFEDNHVFFYGDVAQMMHEDLEDIVVACNTVSFAQEASTRDGFFFLKTDAEMFDAQASIAGAGRCAS